MADKKRKSQAERAASAAKSKSHKKNTAKKDVKTEPKVPYRLISSACFLGAFILFLIIFLTPEGALITFISDFIHGMIGRIGFIVSIPVLLYLFLIHAFSHGRPVMMRSICLGAFVLLCACISHLDNTLDVHPEGIALLGSLYNSGISGLTGGVLCGLISTFLHWLCGTIVSYIILIFAAIVTLLAGINITIPGIIRAVKNRPRAQWEDEEEEKEDRATVVVNHIANKRIEHIENKRQRAAELAAQEEAAFIQAQIPKKKTNNVNEILDQIRSDVEEPVAAAAAQTVNAEPSVNSDIIPVCDKSNTEVCDAESLADAPVLKPVVETPMETTAAMPPLEVDHAALERKVKKVKVTAKDTAESAAQVAEEIAAAEVQLKPEYCYPPIELLKLPSGGAADGTSEMQMNTRRLNETLASFKIEAHIINVTRGPSVTRYEVELEKGVRLNKLTTAADDIALSLGATGVRIAAIPGKISVVGIEVPNKAVTMVSLREVIDSKEFTGAKSKSTFAVGKDIGGNCIVGNIAKLPHMLIAGTTGSGKSVCMNSIIISLLYKASPDDVKLIMVDPKMVELGIYNGIPHLLIPVVTDPKKAAGSLQWAVTEMMRRYKSMSDAGVRDLESYNSIVESQEMEGKKLPQVVVIIDELADLMLVAAKEVEESICRIAQMGRAAGIHLVIATQRPSADVITGLMKANIPSRIAFSVASAMESRIILDTQGAEKLVGKGDMLFAPIGEGKPKRVQGCFVSDPEVEAVASYVKSHFVTEYDQQVMEEIERKAVQTGSGKATASDPEPNADELDGDEMLPAAVDVILETGQASVSMLQRRLKLGYARAARIVDEMEEKGIVGPFQGSKPREILITKDQWEAMRSGGSAQMGFDDLTSGDTAVPEDF